ncbi:MAG: hypothetical protein HY905_03825 [Deltaproteobacteria bacterium]|nr:hypothetical protein [Deltaproteobacteria bacterium]
MPIFWGYPAPQSMQPLLDAVQRGEVVLGGCCGDAKGNRPPWYCKACKSRW